MKRILSLILAALMLLSVTLIFPSCSHEGEEPNSPGMTADTVSELNPSGSITPGAPNIDDLPKRCVMGWDTCLYENYYFFLNREKFELSYQNLSDPNPKTLPVYHDVLADQKEKPFSGMHSALFLLVDPRATARNGNIPVLIMADLTYRFDEFGKGNPVYQIISFNMATQKITKIQDEIPDQMQHLMLYGDRLFYSIDRGDEGWDIYSICTDGTDLRKMDNPDGAINFLWYVEDDRIYYTVGLNELYSCDLNFENVTHYFPIAQRFMLFVYDGYLYFDVNFQRHGEETQKTWDTFDICRCPVGDPSAVETVMQGVTGAKFHDGSLYFFSEENVIFEEDFEDQYGSRILYALDLESGDVTTIYDRSNEKTSLSMECFYGRSLILRQYVVNGEQEGYSLLDLSTGKETVISRIIH